MGRLKSVKFSKNSIFAIVGVFALLLVISSITGCVSKSEHEMLGERYAKVQKEMSGFNEEVKRVQKVNEDNKVKLTQLEQQAAKLIKENKELKASNQRLMKEKQALEEKIAKQAKVSPLA